MLQRSKKKHIFQKFSPVPTWVATEFFVQLTWALVESYSDSAVPQLLASEGFKFKMSRVADVQTLWMVACTECLAAMPADAVKFVCCWQSTSVKSESFSGFHTPPKQWMSESPQTQVISPPQNMQETMVVSLSAIVQTDVRLRRFDWQYLILWNLCLRNH